MTPIALDTGNDYIINVPKQRTSGITSIISIRIAESPLTYNEAPTIDLSNSIKELAKYEKRKNRKIYKTMSEIEEVLG